MSETIEKAIELLKPKAQAYQPAHILHEVMVGTDRNRLEVHDSLDTYCGNCIEQAVRDKKRQYFLERQAEMGKIFEYQEKGYWIQPMYRWGKKDGKCTGLYLQKVKPKGERDQVLMQLKKNLRKKYPARMIFESEAHHPNEHEGFELCDGCSVIFAQGLILDYQELEHWEKIVTDEDMKGVVYDEMRAYELTIILQQTGGKFDDRLQALAARVLATNS